MINLIIGLVKDTYGIIMIWKESKPIEATPNLRKIDITI